MISEPLKRQIVKNHSQVFRRAYIKRMQSDGTFESTWQDISSYVKRFGRISQSLDSDRYNKIAFRSTNITVNNHDGSFLDETDNRSLWFGYASQQRTLIKIEAGYLHSSLGSNGIYTRYETPAATWDVSFWDDADTWDYQPIQFMGVLTGDVPFTSEYEVNLNIMPLLDVLRNFSTSQLRGFTSTGFTASQFCNFLRDQTDGSGNFVFRPFFGDTTTYWNIETTTQVYSELNTTTSASLVNTNVWEIVEKLAEAEGFVAYISNDGVFNFTSRSSLTSPAYQFFGLGYSNREFGHTIKKIEKFGRAYSKFYSRVSVQYREADTTASYEIVESSVTVSGANLAWKYGQRTLKISNFWIAGATQAAAIASNTFENVSSVKKEISFSTVFIPGLNVLDRIEVSYDPATADSSSLWDVNNWGDTTTAIADGDLIWDAGVGDSFYLNAEEMNVISVEVDLDKLETKIVARET